MKIVPLTVLAGFVAAALAPLPPTAAPNAAVAPAAIIALPRI